MLLTGCPSPGLFTGLTGVRSQNGYTLNTSQNCEHAGIDGQVASVSIWELR